MFGGKKDKDKEKKEEKPKEKKEKKDKKDSKTSKKDSEAEEEPVVTPTKPEPPKTQPPPPSNPPPETTKPEPPKDVKPPPPAVDDEKKKAEKRAEEEKKKQEEEKKKAATTQATSPVKDDKSKEKKDKKKDEPAPKEDKKSTEDIDSEVRSLESVKLDGSATAYKDLYNLLSKEVFASFDKLQNFARDLNTQIPSPEIVVIGKKSHGKSSIVESFFGEPMNTVGTGGVTKRPFFINVINNLQCTTPKYTIKRDTVAKEFDHDVEVKLSELSAELAKRNKVASDEPVVLQYEFKDCCNMTLIDTPGLLDEDEPDVSKDERESLVLHLAKPSHRHIVCVEACQDWSRMEVVSIAKKVDPELSRTTFVYTKFHHHLNTFTSTREVNKFLSGSLPDVKTFFVTVPTEGIRNKFSEPDKYQLKVYQTFKRDTQGLEQLQFDKRYEGSIGVHAFRKYILNHTWKSYQESIPRILKQLRAKKLETERKIRDIDGEAKGLDSSKLRSLASTYVVNFLQIVERLIAGTSEGNPTVNGQTLEEERTASGDGDWVDMFNHTIKFEPEEWNIPYWENKLYGGQQFERLLAEYKSVSEHTEVSEVTLDDVATASGINKLNNIPNYAWAASDLAQQKSQDSFVPLIEQLTNRAVYVMKRLTDIAEKILDSRKKKWMEDFGASQADVERYPYFTYHVKDLYYKFVEHTAKICKEKCMDEFYSTRTIYWELTSEYTDRNLPLDRADQDESKHQAVRNLTINIFKELRDRITKNVLLKFYNFFLVPMQTELWNEIQGKVNSLGDSALEQIFEVSTKKEKLKDQLKALQDDLSKSLEQDKLFMQYASSFSKRIEDN